MARGAGRREIDVFVKTEGLTAATGDESSQSESRDTWDASTHIAG